MVPRVSCGGSSGSDSRRTEQVSDVIMAVAVLAEATAVEVAMMYTSEGMEIEKDVREGVGKVDILKVFCPGPLREFASLLGLASWCSMRLTEWLGLVGRERAAEVLADGERHEASLRLALAEVCTLAEPEVPRDLGRGHGTV